ncbi:nucleotide pyrophosphohydrolase [Solibacillus sp. A46]|uniref:Nucleotide pyrophosphohydrolase n=1 Tax=Solibacillus faecavium TaxID=2762221 RepID=A0ABR8XXN4_9BACL|nr:MazG nucleotide pyrophosphohydrolase domain-containing protein [Solibacillus faecavium]MBD8036708.1 nucleotide pyrophosphohydrolase [Solibacillus faecavium]
MEQLTFGELQNYLALKYKEGRTSSALFMKLVEEIGEVAEVLNQLEGRKKIDLHASLEKELVDVLHYAIAIASVNNIDLTKAIIEKDKEAAIKYNQSPNLVEFLVSKN